MARGVVMTHYSISDAALSLQCPYCHAQPGEPCRTRTGSQAQYTHDLRGYLLREAHSAGYLEGERDTLRWALNDLPTDPTLSRIRQCLDRQEANSDA